MPAANSTARARCHLIAPLLLLCLVGMVAALSKDECVAQESVMLTQLAPCLVGTGKRCCDAVCDACSAPSCQRAPAPAPPLPLSLSPSPSRSLPLSPSPHLSHCCSLSPCLPLPLSPSLSFSGWCCMPLADLNTPAPYPWLCTCTQATSLAKGPYATCLCLIDYPALSLTAKTYNVDVQKM